MSVLPLFPCLPSFLLPIPCPFRLPSLASTFPFACLSPASFFACLARPAAYTTSPFRFLLMPALVSSLFHRLASLICLPTYVSPRLCLALSASPRRPSGAGVQRRPPLTYRPPPVALTINQCASASANLSGACALSNHSASALSGFVCASPSGRPQHSTTLRLRQPSSASPCTPPTASSWAHPPHLPTTYMPARAQPPPRATQGRRCFIYLNV